jgi:hypothetical protein
MRSALDILPKHGVMSESTLPSTEALKQNAEFL